MSTAKTSKYTITVERCDNFGWKWEVELPVTFYGNKRHPWNHSGRWINIPDGDDKWDFPPSTIILEGWHFTEARAIRRAEHMAQGYLEQQDEYLEKARLREESRRVITHGSE